MAAAIEIAGLRKEYRSRSRVMVAVDDLDLEVPEGGVFGFLGPNGAGKTTTIRAVVGHLRPTKGRITMLGADVPTDLHRVIDRVGAIVEAPSHFPTFSGRRNLALLARSRGFSDAAVDAAIDRVGLTEAAGRPVGGYSLGMRQRLALAGVLVKDPAILILDEPANGLDPAGILEMRTLIRTLGAEGRTVLVSSHQLSEIEQMCDRVAVVNRGRLVASGTVADLLAGPVARHRVRVPGDHSAADAACAALHAQGFTVYLDADATISVEVDATRAPEVTRTLAAAGIYLAELTPIERTLEDAFLAITGEDQP